MVLLTSKNEVIYSLWNTTAGTDGKLSTLGPSTGNYNPNETPQNAFDQNSTTKHSSYGACNNSFSAVQRGTDIDSCQYLSWGWGVRVKYIRSYYCTKKKIW